jgi:hypothetical protein
VSWAEKHIANPQGYAAAVLFPRARDALAAYKQVIRQKEPEELRYYDKDFKLKLPVCVCPEVAALADEFLDVNEFGLAPGTQMYGYRIEHSNSLDLDPLMTGWFFPPTNPHRIISLGHNKILPLTGGGVFLTSSLELAGAMEPFGWFPGGDNYAAKVIAVFGMIEEIVHRRRDLMLIWNRVLGDLLERIPQEQVMPWRVMRLAPADKRAEIIAALRSSGIAVSTNYPMIDTPVHYIGGRKWSSRVINFPLYTGGARDHEDNYEKYVYVAANAIATVLNNSK